LKGAAACLVGSASVIAAVLAYPVDGGNEQASRIIDRTFACKTVGTGYPDPIRYMDVSASPRLGDNAPAVHVSNGPPPAGLTAGLRTGPYFSSPSGRLSLSRARCASTSRRAPLTIGGLRGGRTELGERYKCDLPARVLVRVRAVFKRPVRLVRARDEFFASGNIARGELTVATTGRRPIVYVSTSDATGKTAIFVARRGCVLNQ
jgi:hypothetical protein